MESLNQSQSSLQNNEGVEERIEAQVKLQLQFYSQAGNKFLQLSALKSKP